MPGAALGSRRAAVTRERERERETERAAEGIQVAEPAVVAARPGR